jgi:hypothetical protein
MKLIVALLLALSLQADAIAQVSNKEEMVRRIFTVLRDRDEEGFLQLFPNAATLRAFLENRLKTDTSAKARDSDEKDLGKMTDSSLRLEFRKQFKRSIQKGEEKGLVWSRSTFDSFKADSSHFAEDGINVPILSGRIYFNNEGKSWFLEFSDVIWFDKQGWFGVEIEMVDRKGEEELPRKDESHPVGEIQKNNPAINTVTGNTPVKAPPKKLTPASNNKTKSRP